MVVSVYAVKACDKFRPRGSSPSGKLAITNSAPKFPLPATPSGRLGHGVSCAMWPTCGLRSGHGLQGRIPAVGVILTPGDQLPRMCAAASPAWADSGAGRRIRVRELPRREGDGEVGVDAGMDEPE